MDKDRIDIANRLFAAASAVAVAHNFNFGQGADSDIQGFARGAADKIVERSKTSRENFNDLIIDGENAFKKLAEEMIKSYHQLDGYASRHEYMLGERTLGDAMLRLCPLFPIC